MLKRFSLSNRDQPGYLKTGPQPKFEGLSQSFGSIRRDEAAVKARGLAFPSSWPYRTAMSR